MYEQDFERLIERLQTAFVTTMRKLGPELSESECGLTGPQFFILHRLYTYGKCTVTELSEAIGVKPSAITAMVDRMYKNDFVLRDRDDSDRRVVYIQISDEGLATLVQAKKKRKQVIEKYLGQLEPEEMKNLVHIFEKLAQITIKDEHEIKK
ncbi:MarR family transcriptional regulator [Fodinisporobacter ferrooxydans]|uniref:MarR family transcriptional regulator n=1 Tax=Fodinisporobacter ferrooxydans TaxID=2901836 RepID=A0ABY4CSB5_9BACL|nr:MarR family transcriptional regulator [Alicyclobacillaceae bacterium MYW30-H2]